MHTPVRVAAARAVAAALLLAARPAPGQLAAASGTQDVTFGGPVAPVTNVFPFVSYHFAPALRYQQLYVGARFGGPVWIDAIRFANTRSVAAGTPAAIAPGTYLVRLAVTSRDENALGLDFDANLSGTPATFLSGAVGPGSLRLAGAPFQFDPALGNLLLDVTVLTQDVAGSFGLDQSQDVADGTSRVYVTFPGPNAPSVVRADAQGLITTFETRAAVVPEPSPVALTVAGLGAMVVWHRRARQGA